MTDTRITTSRVKQRTLLAAIGLMERVGINVTTERLDPNTVRLTVSVPPDSADPHGARLAAAQHSESNAQTT
jgi:hypothetical protein